MLQFNTLNLKENKNNNNNNNNNNKLYAGNSINIKYIYKFERYFFL